LTADRIDLNNSESRFLGPFGRPKIITLFVKTIAQEKFEDTKGVVK